MFHIDMDCECMLCAVISLPVLSLAAVTNLPALCLFLS